MRPNFPSRINHGKLLVLVIINGSSPIWLDKFQLLKGERCEKGATKWLVGAGSARYCFLLCQNAGINELDRKLLVSSR